MIRRLAATPSAGLFRSDGRFGAEIYCGDSPSLVPEVPATDGYQRTGLPGFVAKFPYWRPAGVVPSALGDQEALLYFLLGEATR